MTRAKTVLAAVVLTIQLAACGGSGSASSTTTTAKVTTTTTASADGSAGGTDSGTGSDGGTVDANEASIDELSAAFEAAGIPNAARWAREVDEYRPYPTDDPGFAKLRQELSKYNPSDEVLEQILAELTL
jgi:hypothetical protein